MGTSLTRKHTLLGPYRRRIIPMVSGGSEGGWQFSYERGTPVPCLQPASSLESGRRLIWTNQNQFDKGSMHGIGAREKCCVNRSQRLHVTGARRYVGTSLMRKCPPP
jgi:hypothetical protein